MLFHEMRHFLQVFPETEQTSIIRSFDNLLSKMSQKVPDSVKKREKSWMWQETCICLNKV